MSSSSLIYSNIPESALVQTFGVGIWLRLCRVSAPPTEKITAKIKLLRGEEVLKMDKCESQPTLRGDMCEFMSTGLRTKLPSSLIRGTIIRLEFYSKIMFFKRCVAECSLAVADLTSSQKEQELLLPNGWRLWLLVQEAPKSYEQEQMLKRQQEQQLLERERELNNNNNSLNYNNNNTNNNDRTNDNASSSSSAQPWWNKFSKEYWDLNHQKVEEHEHARQQGIIRQHVRAVARAGNEIAPLFPLAKCASCGVQVLDIAGERMLGVNPNYCCVCGNWYCIACKAGVLVMDSRAHATHATRREAMGLKCRAGCVEHPAVFVPETELT